MAKTTHQRLNIILTSAVAAALRERVKGGERSAYIEHLLKQALGLGLGSIEATHRMKVRELVRENDGLRERNTRLETTNRRNDEIINRVVSEGGQAFKLNWGRTHCEKCGAELPQGECLKCKTDKKA